MLGDWFEIKDEEQRMSLLLDYLITLDQQGYSDFASTIRTDHKLAVQELHDHEGDELKAWGPYIEDQMAYVMARERTGARDPKWSARHRYLEEIVQYLEWLSEASESAWAVVAIASPLRKHSNTTDCIRNETDRKSGLYRKACPGNLPTTASQSATGSFGPNATRAL